MKATRRQVLSTLVFATLLGCASRATTEPRPPVRAAKLQAEQTVGERLGQGAALVVGIHTDKFPGTFCFQTESGEYDGFDIRLVNEVIVPGLQQKLGLENPIPVRLEHYAWPDVFSQMGRDVDFSLSSISMSDEREREFGIRFSEPYLETSIAAISLVSADAVAKPGIVPVAELTDKRIAVHQGLSSAGLVTSTPVDSGSETPNTEHSVSAVRSKFVKLVENNDVAFKAVIDGEAEIVLYDYIRGLGEVGRFPVANKRWEVRVIDFGDDHTGREQYGLAFPAEGGDDLRVLVDEILGESGPQIEVLLGEFGLKALPSR